MGNLIAGFIAGLTVAVIIATFTISNYPYPFPEPDGKVIISGEEWRWYDTKPDITGISPKVWVSKDKVIYEPTGVKFPEWGEALERKDDGSTGDRVTETLLRRGVVYGVRRQACRCESPNRL